MTTLERQIANELEQGGWTVLNSGWPDFLCIHNEQVMALEIKLDRDPVNPRQRAMHDALAKIGLETHIVRYSSAFSILHKQIVPFKQDRPFSAYDILRKKVRAR